MLPHTFRPFLRTALAVLGLASTTIARDKAPVAPGKYEDWHDLDKVEIVTPFKLADYRSVVVLPLETKDAELPDKSDDSAKAIAQVVGAITTTFVKGVAENAPKGVSVAPGAAGGAGALVIKARVVKINPGSEAARSFLGVAGAVAGAAKVDIAGEVLDGKTKKVLFRFEQERSSGMGGHRGGVSIGGFHVGGDNPYAVLLNRSAGEVGEDVGGALKAF